MSLLDDIKNDKETLIALAMAAREMAADMGLSTEDLNNLALEHSSEVNQRIAELEKVLGEIELPSPTDHPTQPVSGSTERKEWQLCEQVLRFRLQHPDALVCHFDRRITYSDGFIRFILECLDVWEYSHELFCEQVEIPYQTLCSWIKEYNSNC